MPDSMNDVLQSYVERSKASREKFLADSSRLASAIAGGSNEQFDRTAEEVLGLERESDEASEDAG